jgi:hypothetical protein
MYNDRYGSNASEMAFPKIKVRSSPFELTVSNDSRSCLSDKGILKGDTCCENRFSR